MRLGRRRKKCAESNVAGARRARCLRKLQIVVAGRTENGPGPQRLAGGGKFAVIQAEVCAVGTESRGEAPVVVDDQRHAMAAAQRLQRLRLMLAQRAVGLLVAVLQPCRTGLQHRLGVTYIQRINTKGGQDLSKACGPADVGDKLTLPYQADYIFWKAM